MAIDLIDTHCHLEMLQIPAQQVLDDAQDMNVNRCITIGTNPESLTQVCNLTQKLPNVYGTLGIHPHHAQEYCEEIENQIKLLAKQSSKVIAVGEIGLDYHYMHSDQESQKEAFQNQIKLANELKLPVVLHSRDAEDDTLEILQRHVALKKGVAHSFTGSLEMAMQLVEMGWFIGVNGIVTFKNAKSVQEMVSQIPLEHLLLETDAPYLAPVPYRGKPNAPAYLPHIAEFVANLHDISLDTLANQTTANAKRLFALPD